MMRSFWKQPMWTLALLVLALGLAAPAAAVDADVCYECHDAAELGSHDVHLRIESFEVRGRAVGCEGCHGPGMEHAESGDPEMIARLGEGAETDAVCLQCHRVKHFPEWQVSVHATEGVACLDCHAVHAESDPAGSCSSCHAEQELQFRLPSRHPVREGKMSCSSCHDVHGAGEAMLKSRLRKNDLCHTCHQAQEGPFIFEHPPVQEDCSLCHAPHGSVADNLLTANQPMLCLQCHEFHFHSGYRAADAAEVDVGGFERENPFGPTGMNIAFTTNCTQCHSQIHGSDLPAQTVPGGGKGLIR